LEFNDSIIKDFDVKKMPSECFGGKESEDNNENWSKGDTSSTNAYMLVYEKVTKNQIELEFADVQEKQSVLDSLSISVQETDLNVKLGYDRFSRIVPNDLYRVSHCLKQSLTHRMHGSTTISSCSKSISIQKSSLNSIETSSTPLNGLPTLSPLRHLK
jgi:hypothetical protein